LKKCMYVYSVLSPFKKILGRIETTPPASFINSYLKKYIYIEGEDIILSAGVSFLN
jgi:hypothetical protein